MKPTPAPAPMYGVTTYGDRARREVVQHVRHGRNLVDLAIDEAERAVQVLDGAAAPIVATEAFQLHSRADEVVAGLTADRVACIRRIAVVV